MKNKTKLLSLISTSLIGLALSLGVSGASKKGLVETKAYYTPSTHYEVSDTASELASYYSSISDGDSGNSLLSKLQSLNNTKRKKTMGYSSMGTSISSSPYSYTDYDLNSTTTDSNGQVYGTKVASFYTKTASTSWNREHVWPNSRGGSSVEGDILHTRPTISSENSSRGNSMYVEGKNSSSSGWDPYTAGYDIACRGECARIILYSVVASTNLSLVASDNDDTSNKTMGNMNTLIKWHFDYSPSVYEMNRNNGAEYLQGNRNPFVDHPEYVARIWSNFNSTISNLCTTNASMYENWVPGSASTYGSNDAVNFVGVNISKTTASVTVDGTTTISATSSDSSNITWTTSNSSVASISSGTATSGSSITITGVSEGTATITAKATISGTQYTKTCTVTVTSSGSSGGGGQGQSDGDVTIAVDDIPTAYSGTSFEASGYTFGCSNIGNSYTSGAMQFKSGQGYLYNTTAMSGITKIAIASPSSGSFSGTIYTGSSSHPTSGTSYSISSGSSVNITGNPSYFTLAAGTVSGGAKCGAITITLGSASTKTLSSISVSTAPTKTTYTAGEYFDPTGLVITRTYSDSTSDTYTYLGHTSDFTFTPSTSTALTTSNTSETIGYGGKTCSQPITVNAAKTLSSIAVSTAPTKTSYTTGENFDPTGLVIRRNYSDSTYDTYTYAGHTSEFTFSPSLSAYLTTSNTSVTITYGGKSTTQAITVTAPKTLSSITVSTAPTKTTYTAGETFDPTGLVIRRNYSDSTYDTYTYANHTSEFTFSPSTSTALTTSNTSVTITYSGKSTTQAITVNAAAKTLSSISVSGGKTSFTIDESFSFGGTVTAHFSDSSTSDVTASATFSGYNMSVPGNYTVTVSYTYGGTTKTATYSITVSSSGGSGGSTEEGSQRISASTSSTHYLTGDICPTGSTSSATATCDAFDVSWLKNSSSNSIAYTYAEMRIYSGHSFTITPKEGYTITSVVLEANTTGYASAVGGTSLVNCTKDVDETTVTLSPTDGTSAIGFTNKDQSRINYVVVNYECESSSVVEPTSITATVSKTYYVGDTISASDITVETDTHVTVNAFTFANDGYQFTYSDAASGGALTNKTFTNSISYSTFTCSLTVQVQRKARQNSSSSTASITYTDLPTAYQTDSTVYTAASGIKFKAYNCANYSSKMQFKASGGYLQTTESMELTSLTINNPESNSLTVYGSTNGTSFSTAITGTNNVYDLSEYNYFKVMRNGSGAAYCASLTIAYVGSDSAENLANYIMYEDTEGQCTSKLSTAIGYLGNLSSTERTTFQTSSDYVISSARTRLDAWASSQGKSVDYSSGALVNANNVLSLVAGEDTTNFVFIVILTTISISSVTLCLIMKRRKTHQ